jgi:NAD(P)H-flavin reductase
LQLDDDERAGHAAFGFHATVLKNIIYMYYSYMNVLWYRPWFRFTSVLSRPDPSWAGATGHVQDAVLARCPDLAAHEVYTCGHPAMVADARTLLTAPGGLARDHFFAEAFVSADGSSPVP